VDCGGAFNYQRQGKAASGACGEAVRTRTGVQIYTLGRKGRDYLRWRNAPVGPRFPTSGRLDVSKRGSSRARSFRAA